MIFQKDPETVFTSQGWIIHLLNNFQSKPERIKLVEVLVWSVGACSRPLEKWGACEDYKEKIMIMGRYTNCFSDMVAKIGGAHQDMETAMLLEIIVGSLMKLALKYAEIKDEIVGSFQKWKICSWMPPYLQGLIGRNQTFLTQFSTPLTNLVLSTPKH